MRPRLVALLAATRSSLRTRAELDAEILALRHQLAVLQQARAPTAPAQSSRSILVGAALTSLERLARRRADRATRDRRPLASPPVRLAVALAFSSSASRSTADRCRRPRPDSPDASRESRLGRELQ